MSAYHTLTHIITIFCVKWPFSPAYWTSIYIWTGGTDKYAEKHWVCRYCSVQTPAWGTCGWRNLHTFTMIYSSMQMVHNNGLVIAAYWTSAYIWTGGTDMYAEKHWTWVGSGRSISYHNWRPGEPDNHVKDQHCVYFRTKVHIKSLLNAANHIFIWPFLHFHHEDFSSFFPLYK